MPNVWSNWVDDRETPLQEDVLSKEEMKGHYSRILQEANMPEDTPYDSLPYYIVHQLESCGIHDGSFLQEDSDEGLKNEENSDMIDAYQGTHSVNESSLRSVRHSVNLVDEYGMPDDDGYNFDEPDMW